MFNRIEAFNMSFKLGLQLCVLVMVFVSAQGTVILRSELTDGFWGTWGKTGKCPPNYFVYGYRLKSEGPQGKGDDMALIDIEMFCGAKKSGANYFKIFSSCAGKWGTWSQDKFCSGADNPVIGFEMRMEAKQGKGDNTAANDVRLVCKDNVKISAGVKTIYGTWRPQLHCPTGQAVVAIDTRVQENQHNGDDTALNGIRMHCAPY